MANNLAKYVGQSTDLDKLLVATATAGILTTDGVEMAGLDSFKIPKMELSGLGNYSKETGFAKGNIKFEFETKKKNYERSQSFELDAVEDMETFSVISGNLLGEFIRTKVVPETDAFTYATLAQKTGITTVEEDYATGVEVLEALRVATVEMDDAAVPANDRILFITPNNLSAAQLVDTYKSKAILDSFSSIVKVTPSVFKDKISLDATGFSFPEGTKDINFMIVSKSAVIKKDIHSALRVWDANENQEKDAILLQYRLNAIVETYDNKLKGIYVSKALAE